METLERILDNTANILSILAFLGISTIFVLQNKIKALSGPNDKPIPDSPVSINTSSTLPDKPISKNRVYRRIFLKGIRLGIILILVFPISWFVATNLFEFPECFGILFMMFGVFILAVFSHFDVLPEFYVYGTKELINKSERERLLQIYSIAPAVLVCILYIIFVIYSLYSRNYASFTDMLGEFIVFMLYLLIAPLLWIAVYNPIREWHKNYFED